MRFIKLTQGAVATVSDEDYDRLSGYRYKLVKDDNRCYAYRDERKALISLHQDVIGDKTGYVIDHINRDGLDNTRRNLRHATRSQNRINSVRSKPATATSQFRGVTMIPAKWVARIMVDGKSIKLGTFLTEEAAISAYNKASQRLYPEFAPERSSVVSP